MLGIREHCYKNVGIFGNLPDLTSEGDAMLPGIGLPGRFDIEAKDLMPFGSKVSSHWETHVAESNKSDFCEGVERFCDEFHVINLIVHESLSDLN